MEIGTTIRKIRLRLGIRQEELAVALEVSQSYLSKIESNKSRVYVDDLVRIAQYTNTPITDFLSENAVDGPSEQEKLQRKEMLILLQQQNKYLQQLVDKDS
ncbi:Helix-turn-helix domain-containing protein [Chitinophaga eiseniae]|uniref:Helix-turn-helix domain-containing protein n=1 Tax=Chitinophaga eiseniae TaxID=634771 RepID=A0A1T4TYH4_9BACT|nr:helix-turn-helix transcriptional regulator [Chitinophaga eiseniae]SKA45474.1 Helix-turn-helix domain-containing protein [Chitinophaga eiseniae]